MTIKTTALISILFSSLLILSACTTEVQKPPKGAPTVAQSYGAAMKNNGDIYNPYGAEGTGNDVTVIRGKKIVVPTMAGALQSPELLKQQARDNQNFPMLPNPQVMVYLFPHFEGSLPFHGTWTTFQLYTTNHYALPSEVNTGMNAV